MISRRLFNTGLASVLALPAPKNLFTPALYQEQTKLLSCKLERHFPMFDILDFSSYLASLCMGIILIASAPSQKDNIGMALCAFFGFSILYYMYKSEELRK